jgi:hypothetical protein
VSGIQRSPKNDLLTNTIITLFAQFPTPFRFKASDAELTEKGYNAQLPEDAASGSFMVTGKSIESSLVAVV